MMEEWKANAEIMEIMERQHHLHGGQWPHVQHSYEVG